jgi:hypothetical protein
MESGEAGGLKLGLFKTNRENRQAMRGAAWFGHAHAKCCAASTEDSSNKIRIALEMVCSV